jgi:ParB family transcriptional regulator, chromosome partitioning protein
MPESRGRAELQRSIESIRVGARHRRDPGDLDQLKKSLERFGLLQPITITTDGFLICGFRRLEAARQLGWTNVRVWVRSGLSDELTLLLAERDDNLTHKPLTTYEAAQLYKEMVALLEEDAARRQEATQFRRASESSRRSHGDADSASPSDLPKGASRRQAAELVTGSASYTRLNQILAMERVAADRDLSAGVRQVAADELERIRNGGPVDPSYQRVRAVVEAAERRMESPDVDVDAAAEAKRARDDAERLRRMRENRARRAAAAANAKRSVKSFAMVWREMDGWSKHYDAHQVASELSTEDWAMFTQVLEETTTFARMVEEKRALAPA